MNKIITLMRVRIKELTKIALESNILTKPSKNEDKQNKQKISHDVSTNARLYLINLLLS